MKKMTLCVLILLLCLSAACGGTIEPSESPSVEPSPSVSLSTSPTSSPTQKPTPTPEPRVELLSYEEYFSEERKLESASYKSAIYDDQWEYGKILLHSTGEVLAERPERWEVVEGKGGYSDELLIYDDKRIFITENYGKDRVLVYEAKNEIEMVDSMSDVLFTFIDGTERYRIYLPTRTVDFMFDLPGLITEHVEFEMDEPVADGVPYVWTEFMVSNRVWRVQIVSEGDKWIEANAASVGETVEEYMSLERDIRIAIDYDSSTGEWTALRNSGFVIEYMGWDELIVKP